MSESANKKEWNAIISKKLKEGVSLSDLNVTYPGDITMEPNVVAEEVSHISHSLDLDNSWTNMAQITGNNGVEINALVHKALNQGANGLFLTLPTSTDIDEVLADVMTEYLDVYIQSSEKHNLTQWKNTKQIRETIFQIGTTDRISDLKAILENAKGESSVMVTISVGKDLLYEISSIRALRILLQDQGVDSIQIFGRYDVEGTNDLGDYNLIEKTYKTMSIVLGGANAVLTEYTGSEEDRLTLNIQNILDLESGFKRVIDPTNGSYYINLLTDKIINKVKS